MKTHANFRAERRGSLLVVALIFSAVIGISIVSFMHLGRTGMQISQRALYNNGAMNLSETGLEQAMYAINKTGYNWSSSGWTLSGADAKQKWTTYNLGAGATGEVRA